MINTCTIETHATLDTSWVASELLQRMMLMHNYECYSSVIQYGPFGFRKDVLSVVGLYSLVACTSTLFLHI